MPSPDWRRGAHHRRSPARPRRAAIASIDRSSRATSRRAVAVGLVDDEDVADLEDPGLGRLDAVAHAGRDQHEGGVGEPRDLELGLTDTHRLDQHDVAAGGVEHPQRLRASTRTARRGGRGRPSTGCRRRGRRRGPACGPGRPAGRRRRTATTGRPRARRPAGRGARSARDQRGRRRRLADARRAGEPEHLRAAGVRRQRRRHLAQRRELVLDQRDQPCDRPGVAVPGPRDQRGTSGAAGPPSAARGRAGSARRPGHRRRTARRRRRRRRGAAAPAPGAARAGRRTCRSGGPGRSRRR